MGNYGFRTEFNSANKMPTRGLKIIYIFYVQGTLPGSSEESDIFIYPELIFHTLGGANIDLQVIDVENTDHNNDHDNTGPCKNGIIPYHLRNLLNIYEDQCKNWYFVLKFE